MILALFAAVAAVFYIVYLRSDRNDYKTRFESERKRVDDLCQKEQAKYDQLCQEAQEKYEALCEQEREWEEHKKKEYDEFEAYVDAGCDKYPHLAAIRADVLVTFFERSAEYLRTKPHPAYMEAQRMDNLKEELRKTCEAKKLAEYNLKYLLELSPDLKTIYDEKGRVRTDILHVKRDLDQRAKDLAQKERDLIAKEKQLHIMEINKHDIVSAHNYLRDFENDLCQSLVPVFGFLTIQRIANELTTPKFFRAGEDSFRFAEKVPIFARIVSGDKTYVTSLTWCRCASYQKTRKPCKHMIWLASRLGVLGLVAMPEQKILLNRIGKEKADAEREKKIAKEEQRKAQKEQKAVAMLLAKLEEKEKATAEATASAT